MMIFDLKTKRDQKLKQLAGILAQGEVIAYPTETVYGLGCDATDKQAIERIYAIKGKERSKQLLLLVGSRAMAEKYFRFDQRSRRLAAKYWPGPLSLILPVRPEYRQVFEADSVGVRLSSNQVATSLARRLGRPIISTSANPSNQPAALSGNQIVSYFAEESGLIKALADDGALDFSPGSTIVDMTVAPGKILRQGAVRLSEKELA